MFLKKNCALNLDSCNLQVNTFCIMKVLAGDFVAHDTSSLPTRSSTSNAMFVGHVIMSMPCYSKGHVCMNHL